ncbi:galactokinase [Dongshaea marina]|uniref:galactokinase n=1 Tax=Dongshaea marina TaxID=2047966 RepID=UPI000D3E37D3|nr:galactokinase [Dongshaea marina]
MAPLQRVKTIFQEIFSSAPAMLVQAPGRVNLIGEHTDYNDGFVLPCAIDFQNCIAIGPRDDGQLVAIAADYDNQSDEFDLGSEIPKHANQLWSNYVRGVCHHLKARGYAPGGANLVISGNVPQGAGLSSSAALEVVVAQALNELYQLNIPKQELALIGQQAEHTYAGCKCGIMDQTISAMGKEHHALLLDCRSLEGQLVSMPDDLSLLIIDSNVAHSLVDGEYNARRAQCEAAARHFGVQALRDIDEDQLNARIDELDSVVAKRARHVVTENARTLKAAEALKNRDMLLMGQLMAQSHASMRHDFEITVPEIDALVDIAKEVVGERGGVRMTGGGFGGCVIALVPEQLADAVQSAVEAQYPERTGLQPRIFRCRASAGAGRVE